MARRRLMHYKSLSESQKKPIIERWKEGLFKKANELSVLCGVDVGIILYNPNESVPIVWPNRELATQNLARFLNLPQYEKLKKMVTLESYLRDRIHELEEKIKKKEKENERKEMNMVMKEIVNGKSLKELDARQLWGLHMLAGEKMAELEKRKQVLLEQQENGELQDHRVVMNNIGGAAGPVSNYTPHPPAPVFTDDIYNNINYLQPGNIGNVVVPLTGEEFISSPPAQFTPTTMVPSFLMDYPAAASSSSSSINNGGPMAGDHFTASDLATSTDYAHQLLPPFNPAWPFNFPPS